MTYNFPTFTGFLPFMKFVGVFLYFVFSLVISTLLGPGSISPQWSWTGRDMPGSRPPSPPLLLHSLLTFGVSGMSGIRLLPKCMLLHQQPRVLRARLSRWRWTPPYSRTGGWEVLKWVGIKMSHLTAQGSKTQKNRGLNTLFKSQNFAIPIFKFEQPRGYKVINSPPKWGALFFFLI